MHFDFLKIIKMDYLERFSIPLKGMNPGVHEFRFDIDNEFFSNFENSLISKGIYDVKLTCDKKERMFILNFEISGKYSAACDRCLAQIEIPSLIDYTFYLKYGLAGKQNDIREIDDVIFIDENDYKYNLANIIYQMIVISLPYQNVYDCENDPNPKCDFKMLEKLENEIEEIESEKITNPVWDKLKDFYKN